MKEKKNQKQKQKKKQKKQQHFVLISCFCDLGLDL